MTGRSTGAPVPALVPQDWDVQRYAGREQPYTLFRRRSYSGHELKTWEVVRFCWTQREAETASRLPL